jgi:predicted PurR-regulated permease PerM
MTSRTKTLIFLAVLGAIALYLCYQITRPFLVPVLYAAMMAIVCYPIHAGIKREVGNANAAAFVSTMLLLVILILPIVLLSLAVTSEIRELQALLSQKQAEHGGLSQYVQDLSEPVINWISARVDISQYNLRDAVSQRLEALSAYLLARLGTVVGNITSFLGNAAVVFFTVFFLFREGKTMRHSIARYVPLRPDQYNRLISGFAETIAATVYGGLAVAALQGALVGIGFAILGVPGPVLWGMVASVASLVPLVGAALVWVPGAIYLFAKGTVVKAVILVIWGAGVVGLVDNFVRPLIIGGRVQMHTLVLFFSLLGGVQVFGLMGIFIGPVIVAMTATLFEIITEELRQRPADPVPPPPSA